jgi:hypothetical protein
MTDALYVKYKEYKEIKRLKLELLLKTNFEIKFKT